MENTKNSSLAKLFPVMLCFFAMGFVDLVGIASNYVKADLNLTDSQANIFPSLVFFWFLIFSVPTGMLMNRIGRKKTVLLSLVITFASLLLPVFGDGYVLMLLSFSLLGIGNALMQTSLNPLLSNIVSGERLASTLTFGQFVKAIASFLAPYIAMWGSYAGHSVSGHGLEGAVPGLYGHCGDCHSLAERYFHPRGKGRGTPFHLRGVPRPAGQAVYLSLLPGHHVSCGH